ncbi:hypothetical protein DEO03_26490 [Escherichia coli]|nr:hypothetical protein DEO03_26490 [Escherichia coli]
MPNCDRFRCHFAGWAMSFSPDSRLTIKALKMAREIRSKPAEVMFHSDQGMDLPLYFQTSVIT